MGSIPYGGKSDGYGNGECVNEGWVRRVCNHPDIIDNKEPAVFTTFLLDGNPHEIMMGPRDEFKVVTGEEIQKMLGESGLLDVKPEPMGRYKRKSKPRSKEGSRTKRSKGSRGR